MNRNLKNINGEDTLKLLFSKTIDLISFRHMPRHAWVVIASWKKYETFRIKIRNAFFKKMHFSSVSHINEFYSKKEEIV